MSHSCLSKHHNSYIWVPVAVSIIFSYLIADCVLSVFEITVDTIFICYCEDLDKNDGVESPYYMSRSLLIAMKEIKGEKNDAFIAKGDLGSYHPLKYAKLSMH